MTLLLALLACSTEPAGQPAAPDAASAATPEKAHETPEAVHAGLDATDPQSCGSCHEEILAEWKQSMHSRAHHDNDPVYGAMRTLRMKKQGEAVGAKCQKCHNPMAPDAPDSPAGRAGVGCGACHDLADVDAGKVPDERTLCMTCHEATKNAAGVAACTTGPENQEAGGLACGACHLPPAEDGRKRHLFQGPHRAWYQDDPELLKSAVHVDLVREGGTVKVAVKNTTGHGFPTGFPGRVARVRLVGSDGFQAAPEELLFRKVYVDGEGKPILPPFAKELKVDSRLTPLETRSVEVEVPEGTTDLKAELVFMLLPPPAAEALGLADAPEAKPKKFVVAEL